MKDEGILDGDYVIIRRADTARNGDRVVALLPDGETTLKRLYREGSVVRLQPANAMLDPTFVPSEKLEVRGVMRGVIRRT